MKLITTIFIALCFSLHGARYNLIHSYKDLYPHYEVSPVDKPLIPKIIHQIWIGPPLPKLLEQLSNTWKKRHPTWTYKLWTNSDINRFHWINRKAFDEANNYGMKSDIWRYEILYRYGGVYIDSDFECIKPLDKFHHKVTFYTGLSRFPGVIYNGIIGAAPNHPFFLKCIEDIKKRPSPKKPTNSQILSQTGPYFFSRQFKKCVNLFKDTPYVLLPSEYFYPIGKSLKHFKMLNNSKVRSRYIKANTHGVHHFGNTWFNPPKDLIKDE